ncbi:MAG: XRE family transcriptional regulator [Synergistaceae bacterium]|nr:XRE family transcriptional regulator [Synergistaceae bacterium]
MDGSRIARLRNKFRYSQQELAEQAGVSPHTVFRAEKGNDVNTHSMRAIARALDTSVAYLLGETDKSIHEAAAKAGKTSEAAAPSEASAPSDARDANPSGFIRVRVRDRYNANLRGKDTGRPGDAAEFERTLLLPLPDLANRYGDDEVLGVYAESDSMDPIICFGDLVLFVPHEQSVVYAGVPMVVSYNKAILMRGVIENKNGTILKARNREYDDIHINKWDNFFIRGRIVKIFTTRDPRSVL